jgi:hypothetical protein
MAKQQEVRDITIIEQPDYNPIDSMNEIAILPPDAHSHPVRLIEQKLGLFHVAVAIPYEALAGAREHFCFENVRDVVAKQGGDITYGWIIWQHGSLFVEAEHHAVWKRPTGELVCITPQSPPEKAVTFIPDPSATYDFNTGLMTKNVRVALVNDSRVQEFFTVCDLQTEILNTARRKSGLGPTVEVAEPDAQRHGQLEMMKYSLLTQVLASEIAKVGRNGLCPCGSGKKYKKCHGA